LRLTTLDLSDNRCGKLPAICIARALFFPSLKYLDLSRVPQRDIPADIAKRNDDVLAFLRDLRDRGVAVDVVTMPIVGHGGHGKTTLTQVGGRLLCLGRGHIFFGCAVVRW